MLVEDYGIPCEKIIPFYIYAKRELWQHKMETFKLENVKGMIFGNSYAFHAFLEEEIELPFVNLSLPSQDLFYSYQIYSHCMKQYGERLKNIEYIILDLYDYNYFNVDLSRTSHILEYLYYGGLYEEHNFRKNKIFSQNLANELFDMYKIILERDDPKQRVLESLFVNSNIQPIIQPNQVWQSIKKDALLPSNVILGTRKIHRDTIEENKKIIVQFVESINKMNENIKIIFTLIPQYITMEETMRPFMKEWREMFFDTISSLCAKYQIEFWSYKENKEISENSAFYWDTRHLNTIGARALTALLNKDLEEFK